MSGLAFRKGTFETPPRTTEMFIAKCDSHGLPLWARSAGWVRSKTGHNVAVDSAGNAHVVGLYQTNRSSNHDNVHLARYSTSGEFLGVRPYQKGDADFSNIATPALQQRIPLNIDDVDRHLGTFPHHHLTGSDRYRCGSGTAAWFYTFDIVREFNFLLAAGHRREIYR